MIFLKKPFEIFKIFERARDLIYVKGLFYSVLLYLGSPYASFKWHAKYPLYTMNTMYYYNYHVFYFILLSLLYILIRSHHFYKLYPILFHPWINRSFYQSVKLNYRSIFSFHFAWLPLYRFSIIFVYIFLIRVICAACHLTILAINVDIWIGYIVSGIWDLEKHRWCDVYLLIVTVTTKRPLRVTNCFPRW